MSSASPQSHDPSGRGRSKIGTSSRWHRERLPLSQILKPAPFTPAQWVDNQPTEVPMHWARGLQATADPGRPRCSEAWGRGCVP